MATAFDLKSNCIIEIGNGTSISYRPSGRDLFKIPEEFRRQPNAPGHLHDIAGVGSPTPSSSQAAVVFQDGGKRHQVSVVNAAPVMVFKQRASNCEIASGRFAGERSGVRGKGTALEAAFDPEEERLQVP